MKTFEITVMETFVGTNKLYYEIDAINESEAQQLVEEGSVTPIDYTLIHQDDYNLDMDTFNINEVIDEQ